MNVFYFTHPKRAEETHRGSKEDLMGPIREHFLHVLKSSKCSSPQTIHRPHHHDVTLHYQALIIQEEFYSQISQLARPFARDPWGLTSY